MNSNPYEVEAARQQGIVTGKRTGLKEAQRRLNGRSFDFSLKPLMSLIWFSILFFPFLYPSFILGKWIIGLQTHSFFTAFSIIIITLANLWITYKLFQITPSLVVGLFGAIEFSFYAYSLLKDMDIIWLIFIMIVCAIIGLVVFMTLAEIARHKKTIPNS